MSDRDGLIMTPTSDETIALTAAIAALRQITSTIEGMGRSLQGMADEQKAVAAKLGEMHTDITVMKLQDEKIQILTDRTNGLDLRVKELELTDASEKGARKGLIAAREWAPFVLTVMLAVFVLLKTGAIHL